MIWDIKSSLSKMLWSDLSQVATEMRDMVWCFLEGCMDTINFLSSLTFKQKPGWLVGMLS